MAPGSDSTHSPTNRSVREPIYIAQDRLNAAQDLLSTHEDLLSIARASGSESDIAIAEFAVQLFNIQVQDTRDAFIALVHQNTPQSSVQQALDREAAISLARRQEPYVSPSELRAAHLRSGVEAAQQASARAELEKLRLQRTSSPSSAGNTALGVAGKMRPAREAARQTYTFSGCEGFNPEHSASSQLVPCRDGILRFADEIAGEIGDSVTSAQSMLENFEIQIQAKISRLEKELEQTKSELEATRAKVAHLQAQRQK